MNEPTQRAKGLLWIERPWGRLGPPANRLYCFAYPLVLKGLSNHIYSSHPFNLLLTPSSYILVNSETVVLGGTKVFDDWNLQVSDEDVEKILRNTRNISPSLEATKVVKHWVGLRPSRRQVRIEKEKKR